MNRISEDEIQSKLGNHYGDTDRELIKNVCHDSHGSVGSVVYSLNGSPPKGYAIAIPEIKQVSLYDLRGKRFRILRDTSVEELEDLRP